MRKQASRSGRKAHECSTRTQKCANLNAPKKARSQCHARKHIGPRSAHPQMRPHACTHKHCVDAALAATTPIDLDREYLPSFSWGFVLVCSVSERHSAGVVLLQVPSTGLLRPLHFPGSTSRTNKCSTKPDGTLCWEHRQCHWRRVS